MGGGYRRPGEVKPPLNQAVAPPTLRPEALPSLPLSPVCQGSGWWPGAGVARGGSDRPVARGGSGRPRGWASRRSWGGLAGAPLTAQGWQGGSGLWPGMGGARGLAGGGWGTSLPKGGVHPPPMFGTQYSTLHNSSRIHHPSIPQPHALRVPSLCSPEAGSGRQGMDHAIIALFCPFPRKHLALAPVG